MIRISSKREPSTGEITTVGLDLAKHVFQVHGVDAQGAVVLRKQLRRGQVLALFSQLPRCVVGMEACATTHYWARELGALLFAPILALRSGLAQFPGVLLLEGEVATPCPRSPAHA